MVLSRKKLASLQKEAERPQLFDDSGLTFWTDPYISKHILHAHLDPNTDDASRKLTTVKESAAWIAAQVGSGTGRRILDLGCGPGLYCTEFANLGFEATGLDFSEVSIRHAKESARQQGHVITYIQDDFLHHELPSGFDVVTMIYGSFCVLSNRQRDLLLWKLRTVLKPGGFLIFDVFTEAYADTHRLETDWYFQTENGFWSPAPHLVLEQSHDYPKSDTYLNQYIILAAGKKPKKFHVWHHYYSRDTILKVLGSHKFRTMGVYADLIGREYDPAGNWLAVVAKREE